jgi:hypothetical protein
MKEYKVGDVINQWQIIEYKVVNPDTKNKMYIGKNKYAKIKCLNCGKTERYCLIYDLDKLAQKCNKCTLEERNRNACGVHIGDRFGKLTVIGDGGYHYRKSENKRRHFSLVQCDCGSDPFLAMDNSLKTGGKSSCGCLCSKGESLIQDFLSSNNINYAKEYKFKDLINPKTKVQLRFDFAVFYENKLYCLIEFDGRQHITGPDTNYWGHTPDTLEDIQKKDYLKNEYCQRNNIKLIRISYFKIKKIEDILSSELKEVIISDDK